MKMPNAADVAPDDGQSGFPVDGNDDVRAGAFGSGGGVLGILIARRRSNKTVAFDPNATGCPGAYDTRTMEVTGCTSGPESTGKPPGDPGYGRGAHNTTVGPGSIAAQPPPFSQGDQIFVPGYGLGAVNDTGGAIKGDRLDLWFPTVQQARTWGRRSVDVEICRPNTGALGPG
jgi:3D (Asp-Asp-Asp) domain-containing protein